MKRSSWHIRANALVAFWLIAAGVMAIIHRFVPEATWLMVHLMLLGALTTAILIWSQHFAQTLLRSPNRGGRLLEGIRLGAHTVGAGLVVAGMVTDIWLLVIIGGVIVGLNMLWHAGAMWRRKKKALPARFSHLVRYYISAGCLLPIGVGLGIWLARGDLAGQLHGRVYVSHVVLNLLGWVGITVLGTLVTLWPTTLRTQLDSRAESGARKALPILVGSVLLVPAAALVNLPWLVSAGLVGFLVGLALIAVPAVATGWRKRPASYATFSLGAALVGFAGCLTGLASVTVAATSWNDIAVRVGWFTLPFVVGFGAQILLGALSYLLPVVLGGGPRVARNTTQILDAGGLLRVLMINVGLVVYLLPIPSLVRVMISLVVFGALVAFLPLAFRAVRTAVKGLEPVDTPEPAKKQKSALGQVISACSVLVLAAVLGVAGDPAAVGLGTSAAGDVEATGEVTEVEVEAKNMRFYPDHVDVPAGNKLVITVNNPDMDIHDLVLETGESTGRIAPEQSETLEIDVVGRDLDGWCSVAGHKQMGMLFDVNVIDNGQSHAAADVDVNDQEDVDESIAGDQDNDAESKAADIDLLQEPERDFTSTDAELPPVDHDEGPVNHEVTLNVAEEAHEVAPGVEQKLWTFGDSMPGPTLRGKVGDTFDITLVNDGSMGHSIDFHAGMLAPDEPMRTIPPGEELTYKFTAEHSGIWMYHCSTVPMSQHIANGMFGAVVIDPPDLDPVDHEFVMIQSEMYLGGQGEIADLNKIQAEAPDLVAFNGYANQYEYDPIEVDESDRVRIWVLAAGPSRGTSFHVIGGQFDTVFEEGGYLIREGDDPDFTGASQALGLTTAQGGFVELTFPEAGTYPFVDHSMVNAERGAKGLFLVR